MQQAWRYNPSTFCGGTIPPRLGGTSPPSQPFEVVQSHLKARSFIYERVLPNEVGKDEEGTLP